MKLVKEFFVCKINVVLLYLADMFKNRLKVNLKVFITEWFQTQKVFTTGVE